MLRTFGLGLAVAAFFKLFSWAITEDLRRKVAELERRVTQLEPKRSDSRYPWPSVRQEVNIRPDGGSENRYREWRANWSH